MSKWQQVKLGELYDVHNGLSKSRDAFGTGYPFLSFSEVFNNYFLPNKLEQLVESTQKEQDSYSIHRGDVFITRTSETMDELGMSCVALHDYPNATYNGFTKRLRPKYPDRVLPEYIGYFLRTPLFRSKFVAFSTMTTRASLRNEDLLTMEVTLPPIEIQRKIADVLSAYDDLIENNRKQIKLLEEAAQRLYKEWFIDLRFPGHESTPIIDGIPEGWEKKPISAIAEYLNGFAFKPSDWQKEGKPIIKIKEMNQGILDDTPRNNGANIPLKYLIRSGDILFSWSATLSVMIWNQEDGWLNQHLFKVTPEKGFSKEFVLQAIANTLNEIQNLTTGATMKHIQRGKLDEVFVNVPPYAIMNVFSSCAETIRNKILLLSKQIQDAKETRDRLLPKLINGELEVE